MVKHVELVLSFLCWSSRLKFAVVKKHAKDLWSMVAPYCTSFTPVASKRSGKPPVYSSGNVPRQKNLSKAFSRLSLNTVG